MKGGDVQHETAEMESSICFDVRSVLDGASEGRSTGVGVTGARSG